MATHELIQKNGRKYSNKALDFLMEGYKLMEGSNCKVHEKSDKAQQNIMPIHLRREQILKVVIPLQPEVFLLNITKPYISSKHTELILYLTLHIIAVRILYAL